MLMKCSDIINVKRYLSISTWKLYAICKGYTMRVQSLKIISIQYCVCKFSAYLSHDKETRNTL